MDFLDQIENGRHQAIMTHVRTCKYLTIEEELALIKRGNHQEIMAYITEHFFEVESFEEFIKRGNLNEIRHYLSCHQVVYDGMWKDVISTGDGVLNETIDYILKDIEFQSKVEKSVANYIINKWDDVMCLILDAGDHCAIRRLITKIKLGEKSEVKLLKEGNAEDNLVYELVWGKLHRDR